MSASEVGQYILLLCKAWCIGKDATLPANAKKIASYAKVRQVSAKVLQHFPLITTETGEKRRRNAVLYQEWLEAVGRHNTAVEKGKKGGKAKTDKKIGAAQENGKLGGRPQDKPKPNPSQTQAETQAQSIPNQANQAKPVQTGSPLLLEEKEHNMAAEKHVRENLAEIWQEVKNCKTLVLPPVHPAWKDQWLTIVDQVDRDDLYRLFREWAIEEGDARRGGNPLIDFVKAFDRFMLRHANLVGAQPVDETPEILAIRERSEAADVAEQQGFRKNMRPLDTPQEGKSELEEFLEDLEVDTPKPNEKE
jgi:uncharacterized protein YdaU (DUF1376 family)